MLMVFQETREISDELKSIEISSVFQEIYFVSLEISIYKKISITVSKPVIRLQRSWDTLNIKLCLLGHPHY